MTPLTNDDKYQTLAGCAKYHSTYNRWAIGILVVIFIALTTATLGAYNFQSDKNTQFDKSIIKHETQIDRNQSDISDIEDYLIIIKDGQTKGSVERAEIKGMLKSFIDKH